MKLLSGISPHPFILGAALFAPFTLAATQLHAQAPAAAAPTTATRQVGTVRAISPGSLTLGTDAGSSVTVSMGDAVRVVQLPPGSTDIKAAQPAAVSDIAEGDRVLVVGRPGEGIAVVATRIVLMKGAAIAQNNAARQADWQRRGSGGIVSTVDPSAKSVAITSGRRKVTIETSGNTIFRRYAPGSVKFEEAKPSTLAELQPGDQLRVRGTKSPDGTTVTAEEIVSGAFRNLAGTIVSLDAAANSLTLKDLATKKTVTVAITPESSLRNLPPEMAARFAARARGGAAGSTAGGSGTTTGTASGQPRPAQRDDSASGSSTPRPGENSNQTPGQQSGPLTGGPGRSGGDLSQVVNHLPSIPLADLKPGEAIMVVASTSGDNTGPVTAITLLSGVEPLLAAAPPGSSSFNISPWSLGGGTGEGEAAPQ